MPLTTRRRTPTPSPSPIRIALLCTTVALLGASCSSGQDPKPENDASATSSTSSKPRAIPVQTEPATRGDITQTFLATSHIQAHREVYISSEVTGTLSKVLVEEGQNVQKNEVLAVIQNPELAISLSGARSNVSRFRREIANIKPLVQKGYVARQNLDELNHQLRQAREQVARLGAQVANLTVRSPIQGVVAAREVIVGQQATPGMRLFHIVDPQRLQTVVRIPERELSTLRQGNPAYLTSDALPNSRFPGKISLISPVVDPQSGTVKVTVDVLETKDTTGRTLRPGMFASVHLVTAEHKGTTLIPKRAILYADGAPYAFVASKTPEGNTIAERRTLKLGYTEPSRAEVTEGVQPGDDVIVIGQNGLKDKSDIEPVASKPTTSPTP